MVNRRDGTIPALVKAADDKIYHTKLDAELILKGIPTEIAESFGIYKAQIKVIKKLLPTKKTTDMRKHENRTKTRP
jgi:hypothetical protein